MFRKKMHLLKTQKRAFLACFILYTCLSAGCGSSSTPDGDGLTAPTKLTRKILDESLAQGRKYLVNIQRPEGNFFYERNFITGEVTDDDNAIRQAGTLWSVALVHFDQPGDDTREAVERGFAFFEKHSKLSEDGRRFIKYPGKIGSTGTIALLTLSLIEFVRAEPDHENAQKYREHIDQYIEMLLSLRREDGHVRGRYDRNTGEPQGEPSPFYDGETLLAMCKAVNYLDRDDLQPMLVKSAEMMFQTHFVKAVAAKDRKTPKQFYQWGTMSFFEMDGEQWPDRSQNAKRAFDMAFWYVDEMDAHPPRGNNSATYEGLISAWELTRRHGEKEVQSKIGDAISEGLLRLTAMQVNGPLPNEFLQENPSGDEITIGGVMMSGENPVLRIDVTQHQMHAVVLANRFIYRNE